MERYWWTVWIKVAVLGAALFLAFHYAKGLVNDLFEPYLLEDSAVAESEEEASDPIRQIVGKIEETFDVHIDYENMIFDYANEYAQTMMEQSVEERSVSEGLLSEEE